ncbi:MAG: glycosyltransferase [Candidatus Aureabacteria bacterium]|nr:glycosyltransferase [Candidatus Auribacterota bacterium]
MKISVVIPVYNEINTIAAIIQRVEAVPLEKEIIVVDDCSTDGTRKELERIASRDKILRVIYQERNQGKGAALREGFRYVTGDIVVIQDADLEYYPEEYPKLIEPIVRGRADVVYGSRFLGTHRVFMFTHYLGNKILNLITNILYNCIFSDMETCYKAFRAEILAHIRLRSNSFGFEPEFTAQVMKRGYKVYEVPISYDGRSYTEGKKITWKDGFIAIYWLVRCRFEPVDIGKETLLRMEAVRRYNDRIYERIRPFMGERILEAGAGIGNITRRLLDRECVIASDVSEDHLNTLRKRLVESDRLRIVTFDLNQCDADRFRGERLDTVLCLNVIEHIEDDARALRCFYEILEPGGRLILLAPACKMLYSKMDAGLDHYRRYSRGELARKIQDAGFALDLVRFFNMLGAVGWFINGKILRRKMLPKNQMKLFDLLMPLLKLEDHLRIPFGLSLLAVGRKEK